MNQAVFVLLGLLSLSGAFSASETALFSLTPGERAQASSATRALLARPRDLLVTILFGNLLVNVLYFSVAAVEIADRGGGVWLDLLILVALLLGGEIFPKTLSLRARVRLARAASPSLLVLRWVLGPICGPLGSALNGIAHIFRRFGGRTRVLTPEALADVLERIAEQGVIASTEADLLSEIVELGGIRVREIMTPRVDVTFLEVDESNRDEALRDALDARRSWLPVVDGDPDRIVGRVKVRDLLTQPDRPLRQQVMPVKFTPEVGSSLTLLRELKEDRTAEAVVVDEWGGTAGVVTLEDLFEELVGDLRAEGETREQLIVPLGEGIFRVPGGLSIRDLNDAFGSRIVPKEFETLGGLVAALLGRIPRNGDQVRFGDLELEVSEVRGRRVQSVDVQVAVSAALAVGGGNSPYAASAARPNGRPDA